jgi:hypothetical protein
MVFSGGTTTELATVSSNAAGYTAALTVGISA